MKREIKKSKDKRSGIGISEMILVLVVLPVFVLEFKPQIQEFVVMVFEKIIGQYSFSDKFSFIGGVA